MKILYTILREALSRLIIAAFMLTIILKEPPTYTIIATGILVLIDYLDSVLHKGGA